MRKKYKNDLHRIISDELKIDTNWFEVTEFVDRVGNICEFKVKESKLFFQFINPSTSWDHFKFKFTKFSPGFNAIDIVPRDHTTMEYAQIVPKFKDWLNRHASQYVEDQLLIDKWSNLQFERNLFELVNADNIDDSKFNSKEIGAITSSINKFRELLINEFEPPQNELDQINKKLDYLIDATERLGRKDWKCILISTIFSIAISLAIGPDTGSRLVALLKTAFDSITLKSLQ